MIFIKSPLPTQGNTKSSSVHEGGGDVARYNPAMSPPMSPGGPGSPLQYSPQMIMEPITKSEDRGGPEFYAGQAAGPKLVPVVIVCECFIV